MRKLIIYYNFFLLSIMTVAGFIGARNMAELISAILFFPLLIFFLDKIIPRNKSALVLPLEVFEPTQKEKHPKKIQEKQITTPIKGKVDIDRRMFIKLVGSAGLSLFILSIFSGRAHGAFFGSVPGPGTVSLKDTTGTKIDPAVEHPTDKYKISEVDDSSPAYYGFLDSGGAWYILKENSDGTYRYIKGSSNFSTNWTNRAALSYDYYHNIF